AVIDRGLPDKAFDALTGDDKDIAKKLKASNRSERKSWQRQLASNDLFSEDQLAATTEAVETLTDDDLHAVAAKDDAWQHASDTARHSRLARLENLYIGAFLLPKTADTATQLPSSRHLWAVAHNQHEPTLADAEMAAQQARDEANVLHWWVAFPQIADQGGFDVLLGNPPWERIKLQEQEFFAARDPHVALAP